MFNKNNPDRKKMRPIIVKGGVNDNSTELKNKKVEVVEEIKPLVKKEKIIEETSNPFGLENDIFATDNNIFDEISDIDTSLFPSDVTSEPVKEKYVSNPEPDTSMYMPPVEPTSSPTNQLELLVDPNTTYFFVFGQTTAGKSAMMSGLSYYLKAIDDGQLRTISDESLTNHKNGEYVLRDMTNSVKKGEFILGTKQLKSTDNVFPTEINLEYIPRDSSQYSMPFCLLEMSGEDLKTLVVSENGGGKLDERISAYLHHPNCSMAFICVVDSDKPDESEELIERFIHYTHKIGRGENPVLISVNKWDKVKDKYNNNVNEYFEKEIPILNSITKDPDRAYSKMGFSIGKMNEFDSTYKYDSTDSKKLFKWMYESGTGTSIDETPKQSFFNRFFKSKK